MGIDSGGDCTYESHSGSSVIDYIILSDAIVTPGGKDVNSYLVDNGSSLVETFCEIPKHSL